MGLIYICKEGKTAQSIRGERERGGEGREGLSKNNNNELSAEATYIIYLPPFATVSKNNPKD